jgi:hypothetical protein
MGYNAREHKNDSGNFPPLPEARYNFRCSKAEASVNDEGQDVVKATFEVIGNDKYNGRLVWTNFMFTEKMFWKTISLLKALDSPLVDSDDLEVAEFIQAITDKRAKVSAVTTVRTYMDKKEGVEKAVNNFENIKAYDEQYNTVAPKVNSKFM